MIYNNTVTNICFLLSFLCCAYHSGAGALRILLWLCLSFLPLKCWDVLSSYILWPWDLFPFLKFDQFSCGRREGQLWFCKGPIFSIPSLKKKKGFRQCWGCFEWGWVCAWVCASVFLQALFKGWGKMWTLDKFGDFEGLILCDIVIAVWQWSDGCLLSLLSKGGQTFHLDVILKLSCSCIKPHRISEIIISIEWADFWRFGHDKDQTLFLTSWGHCSMEVL